MVPRPLDAAITIAKPTRYCVSRNVFQFGAEKSFLVSILVFDTLLKKRTHSQNHQSFESVISTTALTTGYIQWLASWKSATGSLVRNQVGSFASFCFFSFFRSSCF